MGLRDWHTNKNGNTTQLSGNTTKKKSQFFWVFFKNWGNSTQKQKIIGTQSKYHANTQKNTQTLFMMNMNIILKEKLFIQIIQH